MRMLSELTWGVLTRLGPGAFEAITGQHVNVALLVIGLAPPAENNSFAIFDATRQRQVVAKREYLNICDAQFVQQASQRRNPACRISNVHQSSSELSVFLSDFVRAPQGVKTGDDGRWIRQFWNYSRSGIAGSRIRPRSPKPNLTMGGSS